MANKYPKPSREWPPYSGALQSPSFSHSEFSRLLHAAKSKFKKDEVFQSLGLKEQEQTIRRIALIAVAAAKQDALFTHFEIEPSRKGKWQLLALYLAAHHVPGCTPTAPDGRGAPSYDSHLVAEVFLEAKRHRMSLKTQGVPTAEASRRAMSLVLRQYGKRWPELNEMKFSSLKRRYHEVIGKFSQLPSIGNVEPPPRSRSKK